MRKAVVIFSGGQDSTTCLFWAKEQFSDVEAISFLYGQKHAIEIEQAKKICQLAKVKHTIVDLSFLNTIVDSALISNGNVNEIKNGLPSSFVPNRNQLFITLAHAYAQKIGAGHLVTGVCQTDYSGYPDCREVFIKQLQATTNLGSNTQIKIHTPLMKLTKAQTFQMAFKIKDCYDVVINESQTCYEGSEKPNDWGRGCGECAACKLRLKGYNEFLRHHML